MTNSELPNWEALRDYVQKTRQATSVLATLHTDTKNAVLRELAARIGASSGDILEANTRDVATARAAGLSEAKIRRLTLTSDAVAQMGTGLRQVADLPDPVGRVTRDDVLPTGLRVRKVRCPLGVILMIYEARPNVTVDAFALCFKSGNACLLKGGREAAESNTALFGLIHESLKAHGVPPEVAHLITSSDREEMKALLKMTGVIDLVIPRGGTELIRFVHEHSRIPMVQHFMGVCHIFVDASADISKALEICTTAKITAPAACNTVETILVHRAIANAFVPRLLDRFAKEGVEVRGDAAVQTHSPKVVAATDDDWGREFLDLIVAMRIVDNIDAAIEHIRKHTSNHTEAILSVDEANQRRFVEGLQSSCVVVNASTRFNDGHSLGLGAEIGISTSKIHAYGPMGLEELTTQRYVVIGDGQTR
ncbi:MAG: glutamate-5-semialdehyde dehydrogenase [Planctomycetes bacterium]|nr:glutamate-5-semialdehyde dehydrogenase [Planctomycetota bacterium]